MDVFIDIYNGYTDSSGNDAHNIQLSKHTTAVLNAATTSGTDKARL
ncbi:hypothetical protein [Chryseobacterium sp. G0240]|nr:hypothetical protein [Chryseobacterium sp. G0240]